ncbi:Alpha/Beta hydrolase protein [Trichoderma velutinum]
METLISTAHVPPEFLKSAYLIGKIPRRALASEPRVSYDLYIPPEPYKSISLAQSKDGPQKAPQKLPLLVFIHGTLRDDCYIDRGLIPFAESTPCAVMAPLFPAGLDGPLDLDSYKLLRSRTLRSDLALLGMLDEVAQRWPGIDTNKIFLMGYSGGAQFVQRFLYLYPERLAAVSIGAPGSVTILDTSMKWPAGIANVEQLFGVCIDRDLIKQVHIQLVVGDADTEIHGGEEFWAWLRKSRIASSAELVAGTQSDTESNGLQDKQMVKNRLGTLQNLQTLWRKDGIYAQFDIVEGAKHESLKCQGHILKFLDPLMHN